MRDLIGARRGSSPGWRRRDAVGERHLQRLRVEHEPAGRGLHGAGRHRHHRVAYDVVGPRYFRTVGARLLRGRDFEAERRRAAPKVAVVNETMARFFFPGGDAIGRHVYNYGSAWTIVGVVADVNGRDLREPPRRRLYLPAFQMPTLPGGFYVEIRGGVDPAPLVVPLERALRAADPSLAVLQRGPALRPGRGVGRRGPAGRARRVVLRRCWRWCSPRSASTA